MDDSCPIEFGIDDELTVDSKVAIDNSNYQKSGFVVLGAWKLGSETDHSIFGGNGTEVRYAEGWNYSPMCYWKEGLYDFAAVMPSSLLKATHKHTSTTAAEGTATISMDATTHKSLTLDFGEGGYDLSAGQHDIMVAYSSADNSDRKMGTVVDGRLKQVSLDFKHQLSQVNIAALNVDSAVDIIVGKVEIYGPHKSTSGPMTFTCNKGSITHGWSYSEVDEGVPYKEFHLTAEQGTLPNSMQDATINYKPLVSEVLVFPEQCIMTVRIEYITRMFDVSSDSIFGSVEIPVAWEPGMNYTYKLRISSTSITFSSNIMPWDDQTFNDIEHEFN